MQVSDLLNRFEHDSNKTGSWDISNWYEPELGEHMQYV